MRKAWAPALAITALLVFGTGGGAWAKHGGSGGTNGHNGNNRGDAWLDNSGEVPTNGHEMDPHLTCDDLNLWGDKMANPSGSYTITGQSPTGRGEVVWSSTWNYNQATGGKQIMDSIDVAPLIQHAEAAGDRAINKQGFHFKLQLSQNPQKHKTFWIACPNGSF